MNNPNPFIPQGSLLEQRNQKRARVKRTILAIFAFNILLISPLLLIQACSHGKDTADNTATNSVAPDTSMATTNVETTMPASSSNAVAATAPQTSPMTPAPVAPAPSATPSEYVIVHGDTFATIGKKFGVSVKALEAANPTVVPTRMKIGDKIQIPASTGTAAGAATMAQGTDTGEKTYVVKSGDNLTKIASANGTTVKALRALNNLSTDAIKVGDKLKLPTKTSIAAAPADSTTMPTAPTTVMSNPPSLSAPGR